MNTDQKKKWVERNTAPEMELRMLLLLSSYDHYSGKLEKEARKKILLRIEKKEKDSEDFEDIFWYQLQKKKKKK